MSFQKNTLSNGKASSGWTACVAALALLGTACGSSNAGPTDGKAPDASTDKNADAGLYPAACTASMILKTNDLNGVAAPFVLADFTYAVGAVDMFGWGDYSPGSFSGYSYTYPTGNITQDISGSSWHISGTVSDYSGIGLGFICQNDASMFTGVSFTIKGNPGSTGQMLLSMGTAANDVNKIDGSSSLGRCVPAATEYDGTCLSPRVTVPVSTAVATIKLKWADFKGGKPRDSVDPKEISSLAWAFDWIAGATPFPVDVTIDDIVFTVD